MIHQSSVVLTQEAIQGLALGAGLGLLGYKVAGLVASKAETARAAAVSTSAQPELELQQKLASLHSTRREAAQKSF
ncbi:unnamed protein product [Caretta caretta]